MTLTTEIITEPARFIEIGTAWHRLWERSDSSIFQSHEWIAGWLSGMRDHREVRLQIVLAWDSDQLCAVMPCATRRRSGLRVLSWAAQLFSDYCDCLIDPAYDPAVVLPLLWGKLCQSGGFDLINLQQVRPDAKSRQFLNQLASEGSHLQHGDREERCMRIDNRWTDGKAFFRSLNKKARNNHTRGKRILAELGGDVGFRIADLSEDRGPLIDEIIDLKQTWLRANDPGSPLLGGDQMILRAVLDNALDSGLAKIFLIECGGKTAAASINFVYAGRMEAYFTAYDVAFERASPGTILIVEYALWAFDRHLSHVDFLRGEEAFKFRMANAETLLSSFSGARTLIGQVAMSGHRWLSRRRQRHDVAYMPPEEELAPAVQG